MTRDRTLELFKFACNKPLMYVQAARYDTVCAFIDGYDMAMQGGPLAGFREWLLTGTERWNNLPWWALVRCRVNPSVDVEQPLADAEHTVLLTALSSALEAFATAVNQGGMVRILCDYSDWLSDLDPERAAAWLMRTSSKPPTKTKATSS
jgi:hypothetical protein